MAPKRSANANAIAATKKPTPAPDRQNLLAEHEKARKKLLAEQRQEAAAMKKKHKEDLAAFEAKCEEEKASAMRGIGEQACFYCECPVEGKIEKKKYSWDTNNQTSVCCACLRSRKCTACNWSFECPYCGDEHGFCALCVHEAKPCFDCGGCSECRKGDGCCSSTLPQA